MLLAGISYEQKVPRKMGSFKHQALSEKTKGEFNDFNGHKIVVRAIGMIFSRFPTSDH